MAHDPYMMAMFEQLLINAINKWNLIVILKAVTQWKRHLGLRFIKQQGGTTQHTLVKGRLHFRFSTLGAFWVQHPCNPFKFFTPNKTGEGHPVN